MATTTIYLSSTYEDLKDYRSAVFDALRKSGYHVIAMEDYVAADQRPVDKCLKDVERADLYVGLFGFRYGYVPPSHHNNPNGLSITELEFWHAERLKKHPLTFLADPKQAGIPQQFVDAFTGDGQSGQQIKRLREYLRIEKSASFFWAPHQLASLVQAAVASHLANNPKPDSPTVSQAPGPPTITWDIEKQDSPYPGLLHFTSKYAPVFFGRDQDVIQILDRMRMPEGRFMIVSGDSGTGKSSVIHAGVLPRVEKGGLPDNKQALGVRMLPSQGSTPFRALLGALNPFATQAGLKPDEVAQELSESPDRLTHYVRKILMEGTDRHALVLFLDQMEELFTTHTPAASTEFLRALYQAAQDGPLWVLATLRSDHLHHCHTHPEMLQVLRGPGHYPLGPIEPFMLEDLIAKPARCAGLSISDNLVRRIIHETRIKEDDPTKPGQSHLPLLAFVLNHLFEKRSNHELSEDAYNQVGGVTGAVAHHAAQVEADLHRTHGGETNHLLARLFESLVIVSTEGLPTRSRPLLAEFSPEMRGLIEVLVQKRLLRTEGQGAQATVSISHETLFEAWPSLKDYIDKNKKQLIDRTLLERRARRWGERGRSWFDGLASGRECREFSRTNVTPTQEMKDYLNASRRKQRILQGTIAVVSLLILGTTWLWQKGYNLEQAGLKVKSLFFDISVEPNMVRIPGGSFQQGDVEGLGEPWRNPVRTVTIKPCAMGKYEVTFEEYDRFAIATGRDLPNDQKWERGRRPVINVSWDDAKAYAAWLSKQTGKHYRLPTESEWEYAARSGANQQVWAGTSEESDLEKYAVFSSNSGNRTALVGQKAPNVFGLHDMSGNVWEWVEDCAHASYRGAPRDGSAWLDADGGDCGARVIRGGSWSNVPGTLRASNRSGYPADARLYFIGFRLVQDISE